MAGYPGSWFGGGSWSLRRCPRLVQTGKRRQWRQGEWVAGRDFLKLPGNAILLNGGLMEGSEANREIGVPGGTRSGEHISSGGQREDRLVLVVFQEGLKQARQGIRPFGKLLAPRGDGRKAER